MPGKVIHRETSQFLDLNIFQKLLGRKLVVWKKCLGLWILETDPINVRAAVVENIDD